MEKNSKGPEYEFQPTLKFVWGSLNVSKDAPFKIPIKPLKELRGNAPEMESTKTEIFLVSRDELFSIHDRAPELFEYHKDDNSLFYLLFSRSKSTRQLIVAMRPDCVEKLKAMGRGDFANYTDFMDNPIETQGGQTADDLSVEEIFEAGLRKELLAHLLSFISQVIEDSIIQEYIKYDKNNVYRRLRRVLGFMAAGDIKLYAFASIVEHGNDSLGKALFFGNVGFLSALKSYIGDSEDAKLTRQEIETNAREYSLTVTRQIYDELIS